MKTRTVDDAMTTAAVAETASYRHAVEPLISRRSGTTVTGGELA